MAPTLKLILVIACLAAVASSDYAAMARPLASTSNLIARLKLDQESSNCWDSLIQLQACTGEIILFFVNGETDLGPNCCNAIRTISKHCWPNLINTVGFTNEESDILEGYCVKDADSPPLLPTEVGPKQTWVP